MAKYTGVGEERTISGSKCFPIWYYFEGRFIFNTTTAAKSPAEAYRIREKKIAEYHSTPKSNTSDEADMEAIREELRKNVYGDIKAKKTRALYMSVFNRVFMEFKPKQYPTLTGCRSLPVGFFTRYKNYSDELKRDWRAELIYVKAIMSRLKKLGYSTREDLEQVREIPTPEGMPKPMPKHSDKQIQDLLEYVKRDRPDFYKPIKFMHLVGRRAAETCSITKEDVSTNGLDPLVIQTKAETTKQKNRIPPPLYLNDTELKALVRGALAQNKTEWLFPHRNGGKIDPNYLWKYLSKTSLEVIGVKITPHFFRKKFLTESNRGGLNKDSMAMANIKNPDVMMKHYVETTPEGQAKLLEKNRNKTYNENA